MEQYTIRFLPMDRRITVTEGTTLLQAEIQAGLKPDAPCGGRGTCGKCKVVLADTGEVLACQMPVNRDMTVYTAKENTSQILTEGSSAAIQPDGADDYVIAFDIGTTTVVGYLLDGRTGKQIAGASCMNPQSQFGADVISRIEEVLKSGSEPMQSCILDALRQLTEEMAAKAGIASQEITCGAVVGNTAMHHLLLGIDPQPLVIPPYMPNVFAAMEVDGESLLPIGGNLRILPNIAGFVGGDTVGCMTAVRFDELQELTLLIDIGTNGEMVLGDSKRRIACSTAAGPAFEGAKISCGMRGAAGAVDHVWLEGETVKYHVIGEGEAMGLCGSGLLDLVAVLLALEIIDETGRLEAQAYQLAEHVTLTQKDVREVQLAKAAIRAGIELLAEKLGVSVEEIQSVSLAGAFGNYLNPQSACRIGMIPPVLQDRITGIGNAAGEGAKLCALSRDAFAYSQRLAANTEFLELASLPQFQSRYVDALTFEEEEE